MCVSDSLQPCGLQPTRLFCPWDSPGRNTGVGCHALLQGIFPTPGLNPHLLHCRWILCSLSHLGNPRGAIDPCRNVNYVKPLHFLTLQEFLNILSNILKMNAAAAGKLLQSCPTLCHPIDGSLPGSAIYGDSPWDSPSKSTGVDYHCLLQCMKLKSKSEVAQSCPTLRDPMNYSLPGSSIHGTDLRANNFQKQNYKY